MVDASLGGWLFLGYTLLALGVAGLFCYSLFFISNVISRLGIYHKSKVISPILGESYWQRRKKVFFCYFVLIIPVYATIIYLIDPPNELIPIAFYVTLPLVVAYLVSLRVLANPTKRGVFQHWILKTVSASETKKRELILGTIKERVISFYFALTEVTIFILLIKYVFKVISYKDPTNAWEPFLMPIITYIDLYVPSSPIDIFTLFLGAFFGSLVISTMFGEYILNRWEPIDQIEDC
jgi:hypothetical protein